MHAMLVIVGLALGSIGYGLERRKPQGFDRGRGVGIALFLVGEIMLFGVAWWWGLIGIAVPPLLIDFVLANVWRR